MSTVEAILSSGKKYIIKHFTYGDILQMSKETAKDSLAVAQPAIVVLHGAVDAAGKPLFNSLEDVLKLPAEEVQELWAKIDDYNPSLLDKTFLERLKKLM